MAIPDYNLSPVKQIHTTTSRRQIDVIFFLQARTFAAWLVEAWDLFDEQPLIAELD